MQRELSAPCGPEARQVGFLMQSGIVGRMANGNYGKACMLRKLIPAFIVVLGICGLAHAVDVKDLPNPLKRVKAGQWVRYRLMGEVEQKQTVLSVTVVDGDTEFVVKYETKDPNLDIPDMTETHSVKNLTEGFAETLLEGNPTLSKTKITANGKEYDVVLLEIMDEEDGALRSYLSEAIPITGLVRMEDDDEDDGLILEIIDFGE